MKIHFIFLFLCFLPFLFSQTQTEAGGIKIALNQKLLTSALNNFFNDINAYVKEFPIPDVRLFKGCNARNIKGKIFNFDRNKVKIELKTEGIRVLITDLQGEITTRIDSSFAIIPFHNNAVITVHKLSLDATVRLSSAYKNGRKILKAEFVGVPGYRVSYDISMDGFLNKILSAIAEYFADRQIAKIMNDKIDGYLQDAIDSLPLEVQVDSTNNYWLDYSLINDIRFKNEFLELNVYGLLYKKGNTDTAQKSRYPLSQLPVINKMEKELQLYVSEYSLNSALYTIIQTNNFRDKLKINDVKTKFLEPLLKGIQKKYGNVNTDVYFSTEVPKLTITEESVNAKMGGTITVKPITVNKPAYYIHFQTYFKLDLCVLPGPYISAKIIDMSAKTDTVYINDIGASTTVLEDVFSSVKEVFSLVLDDLLKNKIRLRFKQILGLKFSDLSLTHKNQYLVVKYNLS